MRIWNMETKVRRAPELRIARWIGKTGEALDSQLIARRQPSERDLEAGFMRLLRIPAPSEASVI